jgi:hypothetical protein
MHFDTPTPQLHVTMRPPVHGEYETPPPGLTFFAIFRGRSNDIVYRSCERFQPHNQTQTPGRDPSMRHIRNIALHMR